MYAKIPLQSIQRVALVTASCKKTVAQVKKEQGCQYVLNGGLFSWSTLKPLCKFRADGKTIVSDQYGYWMYCWNSGSDIQMVNSSEMEHWKNGIACCAMLKDGKDVTMKYNQDQGGVRGRSAIGLDASGNLVLFCSKDGTRDAQSPEKLRVTMRGLGCVSALMLDCGGSSSCDFNGSTVTSTRKVSNYICVWTSGAIVPSDDAGASHPSKCPFPEPTALVKKGSRGSGTKWVQWHLNQLVCSGLVEDGIFGAKSVAALKAFQKKHGLAVDGICGAATRAKMKEVL